MATILKLTASEKDFTASLERASGALGKFTADMNIKLARTFTQADRVTTQFNRGLGRISETLKSFSIGGFFGITVPLGLAAKFGSDAYAEYDALKRSLSTLEPTIGGVTNRLAELQQLAKLPSLGFQEAIRAEVRLRSVGIGVETTTKILKEFSNAVAQTGGGQAQFNEVTYQLGQMAAKGKVLSQDLRPIIEAAPAISQALQKLFGTVSSDDISKQLEAKGQNSKDFINQLLTEMEKAPRVTGGWRTQLENLADTLFRVSARTTEIADKLFNLSGKIGSLESGLEKLFQGFEELHPSMQRFILGTVAVIGLLPAITFGIAKLIDLYVTFSRTLLTASGAIGLAVVALAALGGLYLSHTGNVKKFQEATESLEQTQARALKQTNEETVKLQGLITAIKQTKEGTNEYKNLKNQILAIAPQFSKYLTDTKANYVELSKAAKDYSYNLLLTAEAQILANKIGTGKQMLSDMKAAPDDQIDTWDRAKMSVQAFYDVLTDNDANTYSTNINDVTKAFGERMVGVTRDKANKLAQSLISDMRQYQSLMTKIKAPNAISPDGNGGNKGLPVSDEESKKAKKLIEDRIELMEELIALEGEAKAVGDDIGQSLAQAGQDMVPEYGITKTKKFFDQVKGLVSDQTKGYTEELKKREESLKTHNEKVNEFAENRNKKEAEKLKEHNEKVKEFYQKRTEDELKAEAEKAQALEDLRKEQEEMLNFAVYDVVSGGISQILNEESNGFQKALKRNLAMLGDYAIKLGVAALKIFRLREALAAGGTPAAIGFIAAGVAMKAVSSSIKINKLASGGVTQNPIFTMLGDNPSGKELALPFERNGEFAMDIARHINGQTGGGTDMELRTSLRARQVDLILTRRKYGT